MPQPLPWFNNAEDPTLPPGQLKPPLYKHDEYQIYDYAFCEIFYLYFNNSLGNTGINGEQATAAYLLGNLYRSSATYPDGSPVVYYVDINSFNFSGGVLPFESEHIVSIAPTGPIGYSESINIRELLIQRFTTNNYPWCENYINRAIQTVRQKGVFYSLVLQGYRQDIGDPYPPYYLYQYYVYPQLSFDNYKHVLYFKSATLAIPAQDVDGTIVITYLYLDNDGSIGRGYRTIYFSKGVAENTPFPIETCLVVSVVVSTFPANSNLADVISDQIAVLPTKPDFLEPYSLNHHNYSLYKDFDEYAVAAEDNNLNFFVTGRPLVYKVSDPDPQERIHLFAANNDYWNNGNPIVDINPVIRPEYFFSTDSAVSIVNADVVHYYDNGDGTVGADMPDSVRIVEIHEALQAHTYAYDSNNPGVPRVANIGYYTERIARVLGISVNPDGTIRSIRQKVVIEAGQPIPGGWAFGQWGQNAGGNDDPTQGQTGGEASDRRDGIVYEQRSNHSKIDIFDPTGPNLVIAQGDYVLCENWAQVLDEFWDDLDKGLGWQELGSYYLPNADGSGKHFAYEGLNSFLVELGYDISRISQHTAQTQVSALITQAVCHEILKSTGQPLTPRSFRVDVGGTNYANVPFPALANDAPSQIQQTSWILQTIAPILGSITKFAPPDPTTGDPAVSLEDLIKKLLGLPVTPPSP